MRNRRQPPTARAMNLNACFIFVVFACITCIGPRWARQLRTYTGNRAGEYSELVSQTLPVYCRADACQLTPRKCEPPAIGTYHNRTSGPAKVIDSKFVTDW